jgi:hypothetical protein
MEFNSTIIQSNAIPINPLKIFLLNVNKNLILCILHNLKHVKKLLYIMQIKLDAILTEEFDISFPLNCLYR